MLKNDTDAENDALAADVAVEPEHGLSVSIDQRITCTPASDFAGTDVFT